MSQIVELADAVVAHLNVAIFSVPVSAERKYVPVVELPNMNTLHVTVVPKGLAIGPLDRTRDAYDYELDVAVQQKTDGSPTHVDSLMTLVQEIADSFRTPQLSTYPNARCVELKNVPVYSPEHLEQFNQFTSVLSLKFRVPR